jgi:predicted secreted protein
MPVLVLLFLCLSMALPAQASEEQARGTVISLSAQAESWLPNDELVVLFSISAEGRDADQLRLLVNQKSKKIRERLKHETLKLSTTGRRMEEIRDPKRGIRTGWRLIQSGRIISHELDAVANWLNDIESLGGRLQSLQYRPSDKTKRRVSGRLRLQAIKAFRSKAGQIAKALDASTFRIINLQATTPPLPRPMEFRSTAIMTENITPALSPGESHLVIEVRGSIEVPFKDFKSE